MKNELVVENVQAVITRLEEKLPKGLKNVRGVYVKNTMGSLIKIELKG
jgi:large subunit ribosomal protein L1